MARLPGEEQGTGNAAPTTAGTQVSGSFRKFSASAKPLVRIKSLYCFQELRDQRLAEEAAQQRERREREAMKRKEKQDFSANASSEVKQKLQVRAINSSCPNVH